MLAWLRMCWCVMEDLLFLCHPRDLCRARRLGQRRELTCSCEATTLGTCHSIWCWSASRLHSGLWLATVLHHSDLQIREWVPGASCVYRCSCCCRCGAGAPAPPRHGRVYTPNPTSDRPIVGPERAAHVNHADAMAPCSFAGCRLVRVVFYEPD